MIEIEKRVLVYEDETIALHDVERLLCERTEYLALYEMFETMDTQWEKGGGTCTITEMTVPMGQRITFLVIPPQHRSVREGHSSDDYYVEASDERGFVVDPATKICKGRHRYSLRDCGHIAVALHKIMAKEEARRHQ